MEPPAGCLAFASILSLSLIVYCVPQRASQRGAHGLKSPTAAPERPVGGQKLTFTSAVEDNINAAGGTLLKRASVESSGSGWPLARRRSQPDLSQLRPGECSQGRCQNGSIDPANFVFAVATHDANEPALIAGRSGRLVRSYTSVASRAG